ncbi:unnamed protein product [Lactuca virosa]|uniref:Uncharacterized protein n=1 Tax=Lactuca virosa TaxID=75947 RepID=A0AAU9NQ69_9ASTR|nr:unnamed protein product [Lactuca virosa]
MSVKKKWGSQIFIESNHIRIENLLKIVIPKSKYHSLTNNFYRFAVCHTFPTNSPATKWSQLSVSHPYLQIHIHLALDLIIIPISLHFSD